MSSLSENQKEAIQHMAKGKPFKVVSTEVGVSLKRVKRWMSDDDFLKELERVSYKIVGRDLVDKVVKINFITESIYETIYSDIINEDISRGTGNRIKMFVGLIEKTQETFARLEKKMNAEKSEGKGEGGRMTYSMKELLKNIPSEAIKEIGDQIIKNQIMDNHIKNGSLPN